MTTTAATLAERSSTGATASAIDVALLSLLELLFTLPMVAPKVAVTLSAAAESAATRIVRLTRLSRAMASLNDVFCLTGWNCWNAHAEIAVRLFSGAHITSKHTRGGGGAAHPLRRAAAPALPDYNPHHCGGRDRDELSADDPARRRGRLDVLRAFGREAHVQRAQQAGCASRRATMRVACAEAADHNVEDMDRSALDAAM